MSSPISSALAKLDGSLEAVQSQVDSLRAGLEVNDSELSYSLADARQNAVVVRDLIRAERSDASWGDRGTLEYLIHELEIAAYERRNEELRTRLLDLADELEAGAVRHRSETRAASLNSLRQEAIQELRAEAAVAEQSKLLPGPEASQWLHWACTLQEEKDADALACLRTDFAALDHFAGEMEESYWMPGQRMHRTLEPPSSSAPRPISTARRGTETPPYSSPASISQSGNDYGRGSHNVAVRTDPNPPGGPFGTAVARAYDRPSNGPQGTADVRRSEPASHSQRGGIALVAEPVEVHAPPVPATKTCEKCGSTYSGGHHACPVPEPAPRVPTPVIPSAAARTAYPTVEKPKAGGNGAGGSKDAYASSTSAAAAPAPKPVERPKLEPSSKPADKKAKTRKQRRAEAALTIVPAPEAPRTEPEIADVPEVAEETTWTSKWQDLRENGAESLSDGKWRTFATAPEVLGVVVLILLIVAGSVWAVRKRHAGSVAVVVAESKAPAQTPIVPTANADGQPASTNPAGASSKSAPETQTKPQDQNTTAKANVDAAQPKDVTPPPVQVLSPPTEAPRTTETAKKEEPNAADTAPPGAVPGALPGGATNNMGPMVLSANVPKLAGQKLRVSSGVAQGQLLRQVNPQYPTQARQQRVEGTVVLQAVIGKDGSVQKLNIVSGPSMLTKAAMEAVKQWRYRPFALNGEPVEADTQINVNFKLGE